jgi:hypothetical protein
MSCGICSLYPFPTIVLVYSWYSVILLSKDTSDAKTTQSQTWLIHGTISQRGSRGRAYRRRGCKLIWACLGMKRQSCYMCQQRVSSHGSVCRACTLALHCIQVYTRTPVKLTRPCDLPRNTNTGEIENRDPRKAWNNAESNGEYENTSCL